MVRDAIIRGRVAIGPAVTSILKYDGKGITYTVDGRRFNSNEEIQSYKIISMYTDIASNKSYYSTNYHVITTNNLDFTIYHDIVFPQARRLF